MTRLFDYSWFRIAILLCALTAGAVLTRFVPTYEEMAALRERPTTMPSTSAAHSNLHNMPGDVTGIDVDQRHLRFVQSIA
jgi:hypothetical protein